jgi:DNA-binding PadR family transcriptional regulator
VLELAILGLLKERSMHGYQLSKQLTDTLGGFWRVSYGSLYPTLRRLEAQGAVEPVFADESVGRRKNVYRVTDKGEALFTELLEEAGQESVSGEDNRFRVRLAFFKYLKPETRIRLLERRRAYLEERLTTIQASLTKTRERIDNYTLSIMTHGQDSTRSDIAWLDDLIAAERLSVDSAGPAKPGKKTKPKTKTKTKRARKSTAAATRARQTATTATPTNGSGTSRKPRTSSSTSRRKERTA